jgi:hypothetical protein
VVSSVSAVEKAQLLLTELVIEINVLPDNLSPSIVL